MTAPTVVAHRRHTFGLDRVIYCVRCVCGWRTELRHEHLAAQISRNHQCRETT